MRRILMILACASLIAGAGCAKTIKVCDLVIECNKEHKVVIEQNGEEVEDYVVVPSENLIAYVFHGANSEWEPATWSDVLVGVLKHNESGETLEFDEQIAQTGSEKIIIKGVKPDFITMLVVDEPNKMFAWRNYKVAENIGIIPMKIYFRVWKTANKISDLVDGTYTYKDAGWEITNTQPETPPNP